MASKRSPKRAATMPPKKAPATKKAPAKKRPTPGGAGPSAPDRLVAHLVVHDGVAAMEFYKAAFAAKETERMLTPDGKLMHGELVIAGHRVFVSDEFDAAHGGSLRTPRSLGGTPCRLMIEVRNADASAARAVDAGAKVIMPVADMFWGARYGKLLDPFGHEWALNQQKKRLTREENQAATSAFLTRSRKR
jgi:PhnB protein